MRTTPRVLRLLAAKALHEAHDYRLWAHTATDPARKRYYERCAEGREDHAQWYSAVASRGEIEVEYTRIEPMQEAAE